MAQAGWESSQPHESNALTSQHQTIVRLSDLPEIIGLSIATIHRKRVAGEFIKPVQLGTQAIGFLRSDVDAWLASRPYLNRFVETV